MTISAKLKFERLLPMAEARDYLADLSVGLAAGRIEIEGRAINLADIGSLAIRLKNLGDMAKIKIAIKPPKAHKDDEAIFIDDLPDAPDSPGGSDDPERPEASDAPGGDEADDAMAREDLRSGRPGYKSLKKRMKKSFKLLGAALAAGNAPPSGALAAFQADAALMTTYPGRGDPFYPAFDQEMARFGRAAAAGDIPAMAASHAELARLKKQCHDRYE